MPQFACPKCNKIIIVPDHIGDFVHNCSENLEAGSVVRFDDIQVIGSWNDFTGSKVVPGNVVANTGRTNDIKGQRAKLEGVYKPPLTVRGNSKNITRERPHQEYIELKDKK